MELFDKRFVHFMWDDELKGKKCFVADNINSLIERVEKGASIYKVRWSRDNGMPFESDDIVRYRFAYYDPNYDAKRAFNEGKEIQFKDDVSGDWCSAYNPRWDLNIEYRVKPECPCADGIDSKACVGCEHSEDGKPHTFENYHCYVCEHSEDGKPEYKPYESTSEFVQDFQERFRIKYNPSWSMPMIWVRGKNTGNCYLVTGIFPEDGVRLSVGLYNLNELFNGYTYLDGSSVGMEVKE